MKKKSVFLPEKFRFLEVKFSLYLNRRVFVMLNYFILVKIMCRLRIGAHDLQIEPGQSERLFK